MTSWNHYIYQSSSHIDNFEWSKVIWIFKIIRIKAIDRQHYVQSRHSAYYAWIIYGWRPLHPDLPSYNSSHFLSQPELSWWIPRRFTRDKFISKDLYIVRKKISNDQEKVIFLQHPISHTQEKKWLLIKKHFWRTFCLLWSSLKSRDSTGLLSVLKNTGYWEK